MTCFTHSKYYINPIILHNTLYCIILSDLSEYSFGHYNISLRQETIKTKTIVFSTFYKTKLIKYQYQI